MPAYVLLDAQNIVQGAAVWDGVTPYNPPNVTLHLLPANPPTFKIGDTYNPVTDVVTPRALTAAENAEQNNDTLRSKALTAYGNNVTYLAIASPTNAQVVAQVQALTKQVDALIRMVGDFLDTTDGT